MCRLMRSCKLQLSELEKQHAVNRYSRRAHLGVQKGWRSSDFLAASVHRFPARFPWKIRTRSQRQPTRIQRRETLNLRDVSTIGGVICERRARRIRVFCSYVSTSRYLPSQASSQKDTAHQLQARLIVRPGGSKGGYF